MSKASDFKIGDIVRYYGLMNPLRDPKGKAKVVDIVSPYGQTMLFLKGVRGAWHPDACELIETSSGKEGEK